jgi:flagellar basal-body rod protein FlgB
MDLNSIPLFRALTRKMEWLGERQRVLSQNIANSDTPNYRANDLKPLSFRALLGGAGPGNAAVLRPTNARHMMGTGGTGPFGVQRAKDSFEITPSGNGVVLEQQVAAMADTQLEFAASTSLYKKHMNMLRAAIGRRSA